MSFSRKCWQYIDDYLRNSSLHGLSYVGDSTLSFAERFCWLLCFIGAASFAGYWVSLIYIRQVPVTITENPTPVFVSDIPFPTVTVCNVNRVKRSAAHRMLNETNHSITKDMLKDFCRSNFVSITAANATTGSFPSVDINHFFSQIGHSCSDMVMRCFWKSEEIDCKKWMNPTITQEGLCCTFNLMPSSYILRYRSNSDRLKYTYPIIVEEWDQERGFSRNPILESIPWRSEGAGVFFGLSLILNANLSEYYCGFRKSSGFKVILNNPLELVGYSRQIPLQRETWMEIEAFVKETDKDTRSIPFGNRLCYFNSERYLRFFR
ncbi:pickpocket protein 28-like [Photinus pyralis]|nr:pickpocket protein 28-like [Photinus pyralis]